MLTVQEATSLASLLQQRIYGSRVPSVRGCPNCGILTSHTEGCKHMNCQGCGHTKLMHQSVTVTTVLRTLSDHEGRWKAATLDARWKRISGCPRGLKGSGEEAKIDAMSQPCCSEEIYDPGASVVVWKDRILRRGGEDGLRRLRGLDGRRKMLFRKLRTLWGDRIRLCGETDTD